MENEYDTCFCNHCGKDNTIKILYEYVVPRELSFEYGILNDVFRLVQCVECQSIFIMRILDDTDINGSNRTIYTIPEKCIVLDSFKNLYNHRQPQINNNDFSDPYYVFSMYREILNAINAKSFWIAFCGMRSVIEIVCCDKFKCKAGKFKYMYNEIRSSTLISDATKKSIIRILEATQSSVHRAFFPTKEQTIKCLYALEEFLKQIYILPQKSEDINNLRLPKKNGKI